MVVVFVFKQKTAYEMRISDGSSDVCSSDLRFAQDAESLKQVHVITQDGQRVPLAAFARFESGNAPLSVAHNGLFAADEISFNLAPGVSPIGRASCRERVCQYV